MPEAGRNVRFPPKVAISGHAGHLTRKSRQFSLYRVLPGDRAAAAHFGEARKVRAPRNNGAG
jgi:hypothetical protein